MGDASGGESIVVNFNKEIQAFQVFEATKDGELQACKVEVKVYETMVEALEAQLSSAWLRWPMLDPSKCPPLRR